jgi:hypothetical protein
VAFEEFDNRPTGLRALTLEVEDPADLFEPEPERPGPPEEAGATTGSNRVGRDAGRLRRATGIAPGAGRGPTTARRG